IKYEFILSDQFRQFHFLVGVLLSQLCLSLNENKDQRKASIQVLRNLICKHSFDSRYNSDKQKQARIASIYLPLLDILMENITRLSSHAASSAKNNQSVNYSMVNTSADSCSKISNYTLVNAYQGAASSASMSNGSVYHSYDQSSARTNYDPLSVIAGLSKADFDPISNGFSDTDSLSSSDDFKHLNSDKRSSFSFTASTNPSDITALNNNSSNCASINPSHLEQQSITKSYLITRKDKFDSSEIKDLLICLIFVLKNLNDDALLGLWYNYDDGEFSAFLTLLDLCLTTFKYRGKSNIHKLNAISRGQDIKAMIKSPRNEISNRISNIELLDKISSSAIMFTNRSASMNRSTQMTKSMAVGTAPQIRAEADSKKINRSILIESNLCHQVSATVLNILSFVLIHQKDKLQENNGDNSICKKVLDMYFYMLQSNQSELVKLRVFAALRHLIIKLPSVFFDGQATQCFSICMETLKCFNSKFESIRLEACVLIYMLLRKNYEHTRLKSISRVHSQTIISVSQLIGKMKLSGNWEILECLSIINQLAFNDQIFLNSRFSLEVDDLTKRIRNIFLATAQMKSFQNDTEMLIDSQYCLAKSYANCLELRRTWLESMASIHIHDKNYSE
ncbi:dedicator of cytokinesis, partial [Brachionus plicatilis]